MAQGEMNFIKVVLSKLGDTNGDDVSVKVNRVAEEATLEINFCKEEKPKMKLNLTANTESCKISKSACIINNGAGNCMQLNFDSDTEMARFYALIDFRPKSSSVFEKRTAESSAVQYFQFYGYLSQQQNMMQDYVRTGTYQKAMVQNYQDFRDKVVLDVGAGSGILSFFAMQAGARKVYAVEASTMAEHTKKLVASSPFAGRIIVIAGKIEEIKMPEKVDIIVSEPMGYMLFNERMLETYLHAKKFLKPNGLMFPTVGDLHVAPFSDEMLYMEQFTKANFWYQQSFHGVDLSSLRDAAVEEYFKQPVVDTFDIRILMSKSVKYTVNFLKAEEEDLHTIEIPLQFTAHSSGTCHGFAFWFDVAFMGSLNTVWLSTAPTEALTHWYQVRCLFIKAGEIMKGKVVLRSNIRQSYDVDIEAVVESTGVKAENTLDLKNPFFHYTGQPSTAPAGSHTTSPSDPHCSGVANNNQQYGATYGAAGDYNYNQQMAPNQAPAGEVEKSQKKVQNNAYCATVPLIAGSIPSVAAQPSAQEQFYRE